MDRHSRLEKSENYKENENNIERQNSLDCFLRNLKPIKAPRDESFKSKNLKDLMPRKVGSSQEHWESQDKEELRRWQWERTWDAAMMQQKIDDANKGVQWKGRKVSTKLSEQRRSGRHSR